MPKSLIKWAVIVIAFVAIVLICSQSATAAGRARLSSIGPGGPEDMGMPSGPGELERRQRDGAKTPEEMLAAANEDIKTKLVKVIEAVNAGKNLEPDMQSEIKQSVTGSAKYLTKMNASEKANYHILAAWGSYYGGQYKKARYSSMAAFQADKRDINARVTLIAMSLANDDTKSMKAALAMTKSQASTSANADPAAAMPETTSPLGATLDFNPDSISVDMIGQKVGEIQARCINGANFEAKSGKTLIAIVWDLASTGNAAAVKSETTTPETAAPMGAPMMMPGMSGGDVSSTSTTPAVPMQAFGMIFAEHYASENVAFLGINIDKADATKEVVAVLLKNAWPWAQAMADDAANASLEPFAKLKLKNPMLLVVSGEGTILFAGSASGVLPKVIARHSSKMTASTVAEVKTTIAPAVTENAEPAKAQNANAAAETKPAATQDANATMTPAASETPTPRAHKTEEEQLNPAASDLYQFAVSQKKTARITGYKKVVDACRRVINEYPDTQEAQKCRELLREIPSDKKRLYNINNEEQGL